MTYVRRDVSGPKMNTFSFAPTSLSKWSMHLVQDDSRILIEDIAISLITYEAHMNIIFIIKAKILILLIGPPIVFSIDLEHVTNFKHIVQSRSNTCLFWCGFLDPRNLNLWCSFRISSRIRPIYLTYSIHLKQSFAGKHWESTKEYKRHKEPSDISGVVTKPL